MVSVPPESTEPVLTVEQAIAHLEGADLGLRVYAAWWLGRFRVAVPAAISVLVRALDDEADRTAAGGYPLRRNAARALGKLGDQQAVPALQRALACSDFYVREAAAESLAALQATRCVSDLVALLHPRHPGTLPAPEPPHLEQPFAALLEALGTLGAVSAAPDIRPFLDHALPRIRYAAARALYQLAPTPAVARPYGERLVQALAHDDLQLRRAVLADLGAIGYLPAAEAIAQTLAENSLKLLSLQGLLATQLRLTTPPTLTDGAIQVMTLMDALL